MISNNKSVPCAFISLSATLLAVLFGLGLPNQSSALQGKSLLEKIKEDKNPPDDDMKKLLDLCNEARKKANAPPLKFNEKLQKTAKYHAAYMCDNDQYAHKLDGKEPVDRAKLFEYGSTYVGENIAKSGEKTSFEDVFKLWMDSKGHRENILNPKFTEMGIGMFWNGVSDQSKPSKYWCQVFGNPVSNPK